MKALPYLDACINEALRIHSTSALGLPRVVPAGGMRVPVGSALSVGSASPAGAQDVYFPEGSILSVPSYSIHRDAAVWGADVEVFRPERWFERDAGLIAKTFNPFSFGPRYVKGPFINVSTHSLYSPHSLPGHA